MNRDLTSLTANRFMISDAMVYPVEKTTPEEPEKITL